MVRRTKWTPPPPMSMHEMMRNSIKHSYSPYKGGTYKTTIRQLQDGMHHDAKKDVRPEVAKWVNLEGVDDDTPIELPEAFFQ